MVPKYQNADVVRLITENLKFVKIDPKRFFLQISAPKIACVLHLSAFYTQRSMMVSQYMNTYEHQRSRSLFDLCPVSLRFILSNICCKAARPIEAKFHVGLSWFVRLKVCSNGHGHKTKMATMPIHGKKTITETAPYKSNPRFAPNI